MSTVLRAREGFTAPSADGSSRPRAVKPGDLVDATDPVVKGREHLFESPEGHVEQATAAPGELRNVTVLQAEGKPKKKPAKKGDSE